jgi:hypothetical protein
MTQRGIPARILDCLTDAAMRNERPAADPLSKEENEAGETATLD